MNPWEQAAEILKNGGVVIIPSDSSFGIAAVAENADAVGRVYKIKKREVGKPSLIIVGSTEQARELVEFSTQAENLAQKYWPGGLTLVLNAKYMALPSQVYGTDHTPGVSAKVNQNIHTGSGQGKSSKHLRGEESGLSIAKHLGGGRELTLAIRFPDKQQLRELALEVGPFILPSANLAGLNPPFTASEVDERLKNQVDFFFDEPTDGNPPSTIVDARGGKPVILRKGPVKVEWKS